MGTDDALVLWTIYDHPSDYPTSFVARRWEVRRSGGEVPTGNVLLSNSLEDLRVAMLARGLTCINRQPNDDPVIVETWI